MLLNLLCVGYFVVRIVSGLLDLDYSSGKLACIGLWRRKVRRWWRTGLASRLVLSCTFHGTPGGCGGYPFGRCSALGIYPGCYWPDWSSAGCCGKPNSAGKRCSLVPDSRELDQNFHDVTIVDMGDVSESSVSLQELSLLRQQWPPTVLRHMVWLQQDLEVMHADAKQRFRQTLPSSLLRHMDQVQHVSACGKVLLRLGTVVAVPSVLVHSVEGHATGLYGSCSGGGGTRCSLGR